jgi:hypothetical protein
MATQRYTVTPHPIETLLIRVKSGDIFCLRSCSTALSPATTPSSINAAA